MKIDIVRDTFTNASTIGKMYINDTYFCNTLEDVDRDLLSTTTLKEIKDIKIYGQTAIPYGRYEVILSYSDRFKKYLPLLLNVPGYAGIRIHAGNTSIDTLGCILVGEKREKDKILESLKAMTRLLGLITKVSKKEKIVLTVTKLIIQ